MPHQPLLRIVPGADAAVLFVHGIIGTPDHFLPLLPQVPAGLSMRSLLLDGHGGDVRAFSRTRMRIWKQQVTDAVEELLSTHRRVFIVAHSMGSLFALSEAIRRPDRIAGLFLLAAPLRLAPDLRILPGMVRIGLGRIPPHDTWALRTREAYSLQPDTHLWRYLGWIPRYLELFAEICRVNRLLPQLRVPTAVVQSAHDELLSKKAADGLASLPCTQVHILPDSGHYSYAAEDLRTVQSLLHDFLSQ